MNIKKGDTVIVMKGKDKGNEGEVLRVFPKRDRVQVEGINLAKKHKRALRQGEESGIVEKVVPVPASNVMVKCPHCKLPTRIGHEGEGADKKRLCRKCHKAFA